MIASDIRMLSLLHRCSYIILPKGDCHIIRALVVSSRSRCHVGDSDIPCTQHLRDTK